MKACINHKCFYNVECVIVEELNDKKKLVKVAYCTEGLKNRLPFIPHHDDILHGTFCPTCAQAGMIYIAKKIGHDMRKEKELNARPMWQKIRDWLLTFIKT
jgi:hypothetical protein